MCGNRVDVGLRVIITEEAQKTKLLRREQKRRESKIFFDARQIGIEEKGIYM